MTSAIATFASDYGLALAALVLSLVTIVVSVIMQSRSLVKTAGAEYVRRLERRVDECEADRDELHAEVAKLEENAEKARDRELALRRRIERLEESAR